MNDFVLSSVARVVPKSASYDHQFGGSFNYRETTPRGASQPLHLVYRFDTDDPLVPVRIPNVRYLPLFYGFVYDASDVGYRVVSDDEIEILHLERNKVSPDFPYPNYPTEFPYLPISLVPISYEEHKVLITYIAFDGEIGRADNVLNEADRDFIQQSGYPFTQLGGYHRLWQDVRHPPCPDTNCEAHINGYSMQIFAVVWNNPVPNVYLWDNDEKFRDDDESQLVFQICSLCHAIHVCNSCT